MVENTASGVTNRGEQAEEEMGQLLEQLAARQSPLAALIDTIPAGVSLAEAPSGRVVFMNRKAEQILDYARTGQDPPQWNCYYQDGRPMPATEYPQARALRGLEVVQEEFLAQRPDGSRFWLQASAAPIRRENGQVIGSITIFFDVDAKKRAETDVRESEARFRRLLATTSFGLMIGDVSGNISYANPASLHLLGYTEVDVIAGRLHWSRITPPEFAGRDARALLELQRYGVCAPYEKAFVTRSGRKVPVLIGASELETKPGGEPIIATFITDLSPLKAVEWAFQQSQERFGIAQELSLDGFTILRAVRSIDGQIIDFTCEYANPAAEQILRLPIGTLIGKRLLEVLPGNKASSELFDRYVQVVETGQPHDMEIYYNADTVKGWFRNMTVKLGDGVAVSFSDITARKQTEEALKASLREKVVLLREIHHRVKNNLQAILNLLYMQFSYSTDERVRNRLRETQNRVKSIALIHEKLYLTEDLAQIDFAEYVHSLTSSLLNSYRVEPERIGLAIRIDELPVNVDTAIPLGIIINELVSNALKHAFPGPDKPEGEIRIELQAVDDRRWRLVVSDTGVGLPEQVELPKQGSLGLQLVYLLTAHMQGAVTLKRGNGAAFEITFIPLSSTLSDPQPVVFD